MTHKTDTTPTKVHQDSKLGAIPDGWSVLKISEVFQFINTTSFSRDQLNYDEESELYYIHYGDIHATYKKPLLDFEIEIKVPKLNSNVVLPNSIQYLKDGDVIIADASEDYDGVGEAIEIKNLNGKVAISGLHTFALRDVDNKTVAGFRTYIFKNPNVKKALKTIATGSKVYGISKGNIQKFKIVLPTLPEQQKIAQILATWDIAINKQEALIAEKQLQKKALMQQLLTGKMRFTGFEEEWEEKKLGDLGNTYSGLSGKTKEDFGSGKPYIPYMNIFKNSIIDHTYFDYVNVNNGEKQNRTKYGDIFFTISSETPDEVGMASVLLSNIDELYLNSFCFGFRLNDFETLLPEFAAYYLRGVLFRKEMSKAAQGATRFNLSKGNVTKVVLLLPSIEEQQKIAEVITATDNEITALQQQLQKLKTQKQGLMQQLLTGKIRVKN